MKILNEISRALTIDQAKEIGLVPADYNFKNVPNEFIGTLKFKVWGRSQNLRLFFKTDQGDGYVLSVFHNDGYAPKNMPGLDLSIIDIQPGMRFLIKTELNRNNNTKFIEAHACT